MKSQSILIPLFRNIDRVLFGIVDHTEIEKNPEELFSENDEEFEVERSNN